MLRSEPTFPNLTATERHRHNPELVRRILRALQLTPRSKVLEVGSGNGYIAFILSGQCESILSLEREPAAAQWARGNLKQTGVNNVRVEVADGCLGWPAAAPFDAILVSARQPSVPAALVEQLAVGGRLVATVGLSRVRQRLIKIERLDDGSLRESDVGDVQYLTDVAEIMIELGLIDATLLAAAVQEAALSGRPIMRQLMESGQLTERDRRRVLSLQRGFEMGDVDSLLAQVQPDVVRKVSQSYQRFNTMIPIAISGSGTLTLCTSDPDVQPEQIAEATGTRTVEVHLVSAADFSLIWQSIHGA